MGLPPSFDDEEREIKRELNELRQATRYQQSFSNLDEVGFGAGSKSRDQSTAFGTTAMYAEFHELTEDDEDGTPTGVFDKIILEAPGAIVDNDQAITDQELRFIFDAQAFHNGQFISLRPKSGKTLTVKSGGNIDVSGDILIGEGEFLLLIYYEDSAVTSDGGYVPMLFDGSIAGGGSGVTFPILYPKEDLGTTSGVIDLELNEVDGHYKQITLDGDASLTFSDLPPATNGFKFYVLTIQDSTGGWVYTDLPDSVINEGTLLGQLQTAPDAQTLWQFSSADGGTNWHAQAINPQGGTGDNLGNHIASQDLLMSDNDILQVKNLDFDDPASSISGLVGLSFFHSGNALTSTAPFLFYSAGTRHRFDAGGTAEVLSVESNSVRPIELRFDTQRSTVTNAFQIYRSTADDLTFHVPDLELFVWEWGNGSGSFWQMGQQLLQGDNILLNDTVTINDSGTNPAGDGTFTQNAGDVLVGTGGSILNLTDAGLLRNLSNLEDPTLPNVDLKMNDKDILQVKNLDFDDPVSAISGLVSLSWFHSGNAFTSLPSFLFYSAGIRHRFDAGGTSEVLSLESNSVRPIQIRFPTKTDFAVNTWAIARGLTGADEDDMNFNVPSGQAFNFFFQGTKGGTINSAGLTNVTSVIMDDFLLITDNTVDPTINGQFTKEGDDVKVFTGGVVRNLSDIGVGGSGVTEDQSPVTWTGIHTFNGASTSINSGTIVLGDDPADNIFIQGKFNNNLVPDGDNNFDLGEVAERWRNLHLSGSIFAPTATFSSAVDFFGGIDMNTTVIFNAGDPVNPQDVATKNYVDGIGSGVQEGDSPVTWTGIHTFNGSITSINSPSIFIGDDPSDVVSISAEIDSNLIPEVNGAYNIGSASKQWNALFMSGILNAGGAIFTGAVNMFGIIDMNGFAIQEALDPVNPQDVATKNYVDTTGGGVTEGQAIVNWTGVHTHTGFTHNINSPNIFIGNSSSDNVTISARIDSDLIPDNDNAFDLGSGGLRWNALFLSGFLTGNGASFSGTVDFFASPDFNNLRLLRVATPISGTDGANKSYVDANAGGVQEGDSPVTWTGIHTFTGASTNINSGLIQLGNSSSDNIFIQGNIDTTIRVDGGNQVRSHDSTEMGFKVTNNTGATGSLGSIQIPHTTTQTTNSGTLDGFFGSFNGAIGLTHASLANPRFWVKANGVWRFAFLA
ncbi:MAG: hypothetical protein V3V41_00190 [Candidatus Heimdallarchaeota archaeon]